jgi:acyl-CoA thioester hydrolase
MSEETLPERANFPVLRTVATRWSDEDVYGHVNNVMFYAYFDTAVNGYLIEASGTDIRRLHAIGVVAETSCRFLRELNFPGDVEAGLAVTELGATSVTYEIALYQGEDSRPAGLGQFVHVYVDESTRKPTPVPQVIRMAVDPLLRKG